MNITPHLLSSPSHFFRRVKTLTLPFWLPECPSDATETIFDERETDMPIEMIRGKGEKTLEEALWFIHRYIFQKEVGELRIRKLAQTSVQNRMMKRSKGKSKRTKRG
jgi:hypothetical protein